MWMWGSSLAALRFFYRKSSSGEITVGDFAGFRQSGGLRKVGGEFQYFFLVSSYSTRLQKTIPVHGEPG